VLIATQSAGSAFGDALRQWRKKRNLSQLELAAVSRSSQRHISFLESGRATPSRGMIIALAESLRIPLRARNTLLQSAGFAPTYTTSPIDDTRLEHAKQALRMMLDKHEPYPAIVVDGYWNLVMVNAGAESFFGRFGPISTVTVGGSERRNILRHVLDPQGMRPHLRNWQVAGQTMLRKLVSEVEERVPYDFELAEFVTRMQSLADVADESAAGRDCLVCDATIALEFEVDDQVIRLFSLIATFGTPQDVTLQELRYEAFFPADDAARAFFETPAGRASAVSPDSR